ncbi:MAG: TfoX/Sxy family protein [Flavobacteriales bacterium]|nr:TfoX/Sxy family protein [Flavobacteriales bacterium]
MGQKGDKMTSDSVISAELLVEKLAPVGGITSKKMFGGHGIFHDGKMFGIIDSKGKAFFKVSDATKGDYEAAGGEQHSRMPYYSIPVKVFGDDDKLKTWAEKAIQDSK